MVIQQSSLSAPQNWWNCKWLSFSSGGNCYIPIRYIRNVQILIKCRDRTWLDNWIKINSIHQLANPKNTPLTFDSLPLKIDAWKTILSLWDGIFFIIDFPKRPCVLLSRRIRKCLLETRLRTAIDISILVYLISKHGNCTLSPIIMVQWKITLNERKLILETYYFPLPWLWEEG